MPTLLIYEKPGCQYPKNHARSHGNRAINERDKYESNTVEVGWSPFQMQWIINMGTPKH